MTQNNSECYSGDVIAGHLSRLRRGDSISLQNTNTGLLTSDMFQAIFKCARFSASPTLHREPCRSP